MNIGRGPFQVQRGGHETRAADARIDRDAPAFTLHTTNGFDAEMMPARAGRASRSGGERDEGSRHGESSSALRDGMEPRASGASKGRGTVDGRHLTGHPARGDSETALGAKAHAHPESRSNEAVERDAAHARTDVGARRAREDMQRNGSSDVAADSKPPQTVDADNDNDDGDCGERDTQSGSDTTNLPDRMLALLATLTNSDTGVTSPASAAAATPVAQQAVALAQAGAAARGAASLQTPALPGFSAINAASMAADAPAAMAADPAGAAASIATAAAVSSASATGAAAMGPGALRLTGLPAAATGASPSAAGDTAFAALATLAAGERDGARSAPEPGALSTTDPAVPSSGTRGSEALPGSPRPLAVAMPTAAPLVLDADFDDGLGSRITWMAEQRLGHAEIRVSPDGLGPIDVRLQIEGSRVNAQFGSASPEVRQALEAGIERLRDLLGRQGMELGQAQVGSGTRQGSDNRPQARSDGEPGVGTEPAGSTRTAAVRLVHGRGLLDEYA